MKLHPKNVKKNPGIVREKYQTFIIRRMVNLIFGFDTEKSISLKKVVDHLRQTSLKVTKNTVCHTTGYVHYKRSFFSLFTHTKNFFLMKKNRLEQE